MINVAKEIAGKSPVAVYTIKRVINREFRKKIQDNLEVMALTNSAAI
jgi:enoyl-CoA hydratase/carnithine racemase